VSEVLAVIGARAGSRGLPGKNIRHLAGKPLLSYPITTARACRHVSRIVLSTDSPEYAAIGREYGAETPFLRPADLAADSSLVSEYVLHAVRWLREVEDYRPALVVCLMPTTPLVRAGDVDRCIEILSEHDDADSVIAMTPAKEHPRKAVKLAPDGLHVVSYVTERGPDVAPSNRQGYAMAYNRQGLPVVSRVAAFDQTGSQTGERIRYHVIPEETALDVDGDFDFRMIELLLNHPA
jgi:CMP-N-acetylneuraminic acid synthetase